MFAFFDLSRPATFFESKDEKTAYDMYIMNEVSILNRNPKVVKILIGTNADKIDSDFEQQDFE